MTTPHLRESQVAHLGDQITGVQPIDDLRRVAQFAPCRLLVEPLRQPFRQRRLGGDTLRLLLLCLTCRLGAVHREAVAVPLQGGLPVPLSLATAGEAARRVPRAATLGAGQLSDPAPGVGGAWVGALACTPLHDAGDPVAPIQERPIHAFAPSA